MASVQAPNHTFLPDFFNRIRCFDQSTVMPLNEELHYSPLPIKASYNGVMQQQQQQQQTQQTQSVNVFNEMGLKDSIRHEQSQHIISEGFNMNMGNKRMRSLDHNSCDREEAFIRMSPFFMNLPTPPHLFTSGRLPLVSTGLRLSSTDVSLDDSRPCSTSSNSHLPSSTLRQILDTAPFSRQMQAHLAQQRGELHCLIDSQAERMKQVLEENLQLHTRGLISTMEGTNMSKRLKAKDEELEKAHRKSLQLEERLKQLTIEAQLWRNLAKNNELMAINLRQSLEQVMVQARNEQKNCHMYHPNHISREEGCGESSEVDDAESCQAFGDHRTPANLIIGDDQELLEKRKCKVCRVNEVCMLLLPCRHLCLCRDCERAIDACPSCGTTKNASVQVYMA